MAVIDTLKLARALHDRGGFTQEAADATADALNAALGADIATRADIESVKTGIDAVRAELTAGIDAVRAELTAGIDAVRAELTAGIDAVRAELTAGIDAVRAELKADIDTVKADIGAVRTELKGDIRLLQWQVGIMYALQIAILVKLFIH